MARTEQLLTAIGFKIGGWNELCDLLPSNIVRRVFSPSRNDLELYAAAYRLANWIGFGRWTLLQVDNSTSPTDDEVAIFEKLAFNGQQSWDVARQHTFLLDGYSRKSTLVLLIYFALLFTWHVHLVSEASPKSQRLALQDGMVYFYGNEATIQSADELITSLKSAPRSMES